ncbi:NADH dehydrogenase (ubiquinone) complex I, assembly factor 2 [Platysternon megacephalum]|uniref:NADH dehydrogenase (Ubiquinone) complex I, assembly factor 2 n=1 Tax=Platysternon megacephalum TaxID=55544 RepID=A0A4D9F8E2_9SAUR|nr:NADH dehydrogenase (ubiquinone) complex I, assembly factor 2 [Platysternon megacephalum]
MGGRWRLLRALRLRLLGPEKQHVGSDPFGNKYYKIPKHQTWADGDMMNQYKSHGNDSPDELINGTWETAEGQPLGKKLAKNRHMF